MLKAVIRQTDYIGRLGGDEFAILLPRSNKRDGLRRAEDLDRKLNNSYAPWDGQQIAIKASCGVHMYAANAEVKELLESADAAMYRIKQQRKLKTGTEAR
jgi:diguanylate cyclase (GGDEF)-like protein